MALSVEKVGTVYPATTAVLDARRALAYAAATNDDNPAYAAGLVPPVFAVVPTWPALSLAVAGVVPPAALPMIVHGEQDMHFHGPLTAGLSITSTAEAHSIRVGRTGTRYTVRVHSAEAGTGEPVLDQYVTLFLRGMRDGGSAGPDKPAHSFPRAGRPTPVGRHTVQIDDDQTWRYRDASGDGNPIHLDDEAARRVGLPGIVVHGLCTMAMAGRSLLATVAAGDVGRLRRLAVRFSRAVLPGADLTTTVYGVAPPGPARAAYAFECHSDGHLVVSDGRAEIEA